MRDVNGWWFGLRAERIGQSRVSDGFVSRRAIGRRVASLEAPDLGTGTSRSVACSARAPSGFPAVTRSSRRRLTCAPSSTHRASSSPSRCPPSCPSRRRAEWSDDVQKERTVLFGATVVPRRKSRRILELEETRRWSVGGFDPPNSFINLPYAQLVRCLANIPATRTYSEACVRSRGRRLPLPGALRRATHDDTSRDHAPRAAPGARRRVRGAHSR